MPLVEEIKAKLREKGPAASQQSFRDSSFYVTPINRQIWEENEQFLESITYNFKL